MQKSIKRSIAFSCFFLLCLTIKSQSHTVDESKMLSDVIISSFADNTNNIYIEGKSDIKTHLFIWSPKGTLIKKVEIPSFNGKYKVDTTLFPKGKMILEWWHENIRTTKTVTIV